jgi:tyrosine-specific transport protein
MMFIAYGFLIFFNIPQTAGDISYKNLDYLMMSISFVIITFGYHNMIPSIKRRFDDSGQNLKKICLIGSLITFFVYFAWVAKVLIALPVEGIADAYTSQKLVSESLFQIIHQPYFFYAIQIFSLLAIATSLVGQGVSLTDFLLDSFRKRDTLLARLAISGPISLLALAFIHIYPDIFYTILELCGGIFAAIIFCIYPSLIFLKARRNINRRHLLMTLFVLSSGILVVGYEILKHILS